MNIDGYGLQGKLSVKGKKQCVMRASSAAIKCSSVLRLEHGSNRAVPEAADFDTVVFVN